MRVIVLVIARNTFRRYATRKVAVSVWHTPSTGGQSRDVDAPERGDSGSEGVQTGFTREGKMCVAKLKKRKAAGADQIVNVCIKYGGEGVLTMGDRV